MLNPNQVSAISPLHGRCQLNLARVSAAAAAAAAADALHILVPNYHAKLYKGLEHGSALIAQSIRVVNKCAARECFCVTQ